ncbi:Zinc finger and SCAN domain-containing protein 12 [Orchesella cincta]|uniref:Zinc finger and SCAN domain-containing protein 12 n=1 Tax=Orchesella cincta TaxID=48709 RepID=A0A1D2MDE4_ORCCI|nr:Zinc finger and SCAN domain-containing protein 12 [Orchesella cincta]
MSRRRKRGIPSPPKSTQCVFCASPCPSSFSIVNGEVKRLKTDPHHVKKCTPPPHQLTFLEEEDCSSLAAQLKVLFILKNILDVGEGKLHKFLGHLEGQFHPEFWLQTCGYCGEAVRVCYETSKEISRLQRKFSTIREELKGRILETREHATEDEVVSSVWKEVRDEIIKGGVEINRPPTDVDGDDNDEEKCEKSDIPADHDAEVDSSDRKAVKEELLEGELGSSLADLNEEDDDDQDDCDEGGFTKISINSNIFADEEEDEDIDDFLMGNPLPEEDEESNIELYESQNDCTTCPKKIKERKPSLEKKEGRKQKLSTVIPNASDDDIQFEVIVRDTRPTPPLEFSSYQKRKKGRICYKCLGCPYFETLHLHKIKAHVKIHRPVVSDDVDDNGDEEKESSANEDEEAPIHIDGSIFEDENNGEDEEDEEEFQLNLEHSNDNAEDPLKFKEEDRKGRKQKLVPICSSQSDIQLIPPPVIKEEPQYTTLRKERRTSYQCSQCPALYVEWGLMFEHLNLHRPGSTAITCPTADCGWALGPEKSWLSRHNLKHHRPEGAVVQAKPKVPTRKRNTYYRCTDCQALFMGLQRLTAHYLVHDNGRGRECKECGWYSTNLPNHMSFWHPEEGGIRAEMRLRTADNRIITLGRGEKPPKRVPSNKIPD